MMRLTTPEEDAAWNARVAALYASESAEDRVVAVLMDLAVGGHGDNEDIARSKARALVGLMRDEATAAVDAEPELEGAPPAAVLDALADNPAGVLRSVVRATKDGIRRRIREAR